MISNGNQSDAQWSQSLLPNGRLELCFCRGTLQNMSSHASFLCASATVSLLAWKLHWRWLTNTVETGSLFPKPLCAALSLSLLSSQCITARLQKWHAMMNCWKGQILWRSTFSDYLDSYSCSRDLKQSYHVSAVILLFKQSPMYLSILHEYSPVCCQMQSQSKCKHKTGDEQFILCDRVSQNAVHEEASDLSTFPLDNELMRCRWENLALGYTEANGDPVLRAEIAALYETCDAEDITVMTPQEAIAIASRYVWTLIKLFFLFEAILLILTTPFDGLSNASSPTITWGKANITDNQTNFIDNGSLASSQYQPRKLNNSPNICSWFHLQAFVEI